MTIPIWAPFALLVAVTVVYPVPVLPAWTRRFDWYVIGCWTLCLAFCGCFWASVGILIAGVA